LRGLWRKRMLDPSGDFSMRRHLVIAGLIAALSASADPAFAFQETPVPPPDAATQAPPQAKTAPLQLGTPGVSADQKADSGGVTMFGYSILPKLDFGLELLYGGDDKQLQIQQGPSFDENQDVTVLGKVKRHF
jgi:hypothetical protein